MDHHNSLIITPSLTKQSVSFDYGNIRITDDSNQSVTISLNSDTLNEAFAKRLLSCQRAAQERFLQLLTDHIRQADNGDA